MTKRPDVKPDGYVEFWSQNSDGINEVECSLIAKKFASFLGMIKFTSICKELKTVAIGRIYLKPKKRDSDKEI